MTDTTEENFLLIRLGWQLGGHWLIQDVWVLLSSWLWSRVVCTHWPGSGRFRMCQASIFHIYSPQHRRPFYERNIWSTKNVWINDLVKRSISKLPKCHWRLRRVLVSRIAWILRSVLRHANYYHAFLSSNDKYFLSCYWCGQSVKRSTHTLTFQGTRFVKCARVFYAVIRKGEGFKSSLWNVPRSWQVINYLVYVFIYILYIEIEDGNLARGRVLFYFTLF